MDQNFEILDLSLFEEAYLLALKYPYETYFLIFVLLICATILIFLDDRPNP